MQIQSSAPNFGLKMSSAPLVSVVIPVFNRSDVLRRAIASVYAQTFKDYELIIVDDGSTHPVADVIADELKQPNTHLLRHETNRGAAASRNTGCRKARGDYVAFLDSDDEWSTDKLARQLTLMKSEPGVRACCTGFALLSQGAVFDRRLPPAVSDVDEILWGCRISPGSTLIVERTLWVTAGPMDETLARLEDWDWLILAAKHAPIKGLREVLVDVHHDRYAHVDDTQFRDAVDKMAQYVREGRYDLSRGQRMILLSALQYELAAMNYRKGHFGAAMGALGTSFLYCPWKRPTLIAAAFQTIKMDLGRALGVKSGR